jgi:hypothetical protein
VLGALGSGGCLHERLVLYSDRAIACRNCSAVDANVDLAGLDVGFAPASLNVGVGGTVGVGNTVGVGAIGVTVGVGDTVGGGGDEGVPGSQSALSGPRTDP